MSYYYRDQSWPQIKEHLAKNSLVILPIGTTEEHGPHLPVDTDARIAEVYGRGLADALSPEIPLLLMDTIRYGYSMHVMEEWPGTITLRSRVFMDMVFDICRSVLDLGFNKLVLLDCHGHHSGPLNTVSRELCDACHKAIAIISPAALSRDEFDVVRKSEQGGSIHADEWETAIVLYTHPEVVDMSKATDVDTMNYHSEFVAGDNFRGRQRVTWSTWYLQKSKTGVYGTPTVATAETGKVILDAAVSNGARFLREFWSTPDAV
jgi:creatinine amidohydrolase